MITRILQDRINLEVFKNKAIVVLGARQVGKSTLLKQLLKGKTNVLWLDAENPDVHVLLKDINSNRLQQLVGDNQYIVIDEAQKIDNIGSKLKLITDYLKDVQVIVTGSSAFELRNTLNEPLTGRKFEHVLFPLTFPELVKHHGFLTELRLLPNRLIYGCYPDVVTTNDNPEKILRLLADSYLYKDIFLFKGIRKPEKMMNLLKALAWQIGSEVNNNELAKISGLDNETVEDYINLLEQAFVIYRLPSFHSNLRTELKKGKKIYFVDLGIRNAIINDFTVFEIRNDKGVLFENFIVNQILASSRYNDLFENFYFWRTTNQQEVDLVVEKNGELKAFEIKWNPKKSLTKSRAFQNKYPNHQFQGIHSENFYDYLLKA